MPVSIEIVCFGETWTSYFDLVEFAATRISTCVDKNAFSPTLRAVRGCLEGGELRCELSLTVSTGGCATQEKNIPQLAPLPGLH